MGCSKGIPLNRNLEDVRLLLKALIDKGSVRLIRRLMGEMSLNIDDRFVKVDSLEMNPLGYSLFIGKPKVFNYIHYKLKASIRFMEKIFKSQGYRSIDILCINGSFTLFKAYLPIYISACLNPSQASSSEIPNSCNSNLSSEYSSLVYQYSPIQYACIYKHFNIIQYLQNYFSLTPPPPLFDINFQDENTGENCALLACRLGSFLLMKFLHSSCGADFFVKNRNEENAILVLAAASKCEENYEFLTCLKYLLSTVGIDPRYKYEEVVLVIRNWQMLEVFCEALRPFGVFPDKFNLEKLNYVGPAEPIESISSAGENFY